MTLWRWNAVTARWEASVLHAQDRLEVAAGVCLVGLPPRRGALLARDEAAVTVNGEPVLPLRVLDDRDEVAVAGGPVEIAPFPAGLPDTRCGRCKGELGAGESAVRCPHCGAWHHQTEDLPCWTYDSSCSTCARATTGCAWEPEPIVGEGISHAGGG
jgi:hypothetical protein